MKNTFLKCLRTAVDVVGLMFDVALYALALIGGLAVLLVAEQIASNPETAPGLKSLVLALALVGGSMGVFANMSRRQSLPAIRVQIEDRQDGQAGH